MQTDYFENIHRYLDQQLEQAEKAAFEAQMEQDTQLKQDVLTEKTKHFIMSSFSSSMI